MGPGGRVGYSSFMFFLVFFPFFPCSAVACAALLSSSVLLVALRVFLLLPFGFAALLCVLCLFFCRGCAWGVLFVYSHLLKRVCSSPTGASQHALAFPPSCPLSVLLLLACLSVGIWWYRVMLCTRTLSSG